MIEHDVQKLGLELLNKLPRVIAYRNNTGAIKKGARFIAYGLRSFHGETGGADTVGIADSVPWACELKKPGEKPTKEQREWAERWMAAGGRWWWATTLAEMVDPVRAILAERSLMRRTADDDKHVVNVELGEPVGEPIAEQVGETLPGWVRGVDDGARDQALVGIRKAVDADPVAMLYGKRAA